MYLILTARTGQRQLLLATVETAVEAAEKWQSLSDEHGELAINGSDGQPIDFAELTRQAEAERSTRLS